MRVTVLIAFATVLVYGCGFLPSNDTPMFDGGLTFSKEGEACASTEFCAKGLVCASDFTCQPPGKPGTASAGEACEQQSDCQIPLACIENECVDFQWEGAKCESSAPDWEPIKVFFDVTRESKEFYRLPFPNDALRTTGNINLSGHVNPGELTKEIGNPVDEYFDIVQTDLDGFGTQSAIYFRFNRFPQSETLILNQDKTKQAIFLLNIDPNSPDYGKPHNGYGFEARTQEGNYICNNWLAVFPLEGRPLAPETTHAAILTNGITDKEGVPLTPDTHFLSMLQETLPEESAPAVSSAWSVYAPLRDFLKDTEVLSELNSQLKIKISKDTVAAATVFSTGNPRRHIPKIREAVRAMPEPVIDNLEEENETGLYTLYTGTVTMPFYQKGTRPFTDNDDGGGIKYNDDGLPILVETEEINFALTVPTEDAPPEKGWPLVIYAHGTGADEKSFVHNEIADRMGVIGVAVLGMEQVQHGDRRAPPGENADEDTPSPGDLFYNLLNPRAARDNNLQSAAELFQAVRLAEGIRVIEDTEISIDLERIYFFGHSQGTQGSFIGATFEPKIKGFILSGAGGFLIESMLNKRKPKDVASAMKLVLREYEEIDRFHPLLNIIQSAFDEVDPVNFAGIAFKEDLSSLGITARSVFMSSGVSDNYTPDITQLALARALRLKQWAVDDNYLFDSHMLDTIDELPHNHTHSNGGGVTAVLVRYAPVEDSDGHFVIFDNPNARLQADEFIRTMAYDIESSEPQLVKP